MIKCDQTFLIPVGSQAVGLQNIINIDLSRRQVLGGLIASASFVSPAQAEAAGLWWDMRFDLSKDGRVLTIVEVCVTEPSRTGAPQSNSSKLTRSDYCRWRVPAAAFGPLAWFDLIKPGGVVSKSQAPSRRVLVRNASYGTRKAVTVAFRFTRGGAGPEAGRWRIEYETDLWLSSQGTTLEVASSPTVAFEEFLGKAKLSEHLAATRVEKTVQKVFGERLALSAKPPEKFDVTLDKHLVWRTRAEGTGGLAAFSRQVIIPELALAWHRTPGDRSFFFAGEAKLRRIADVPTTIRIGDLQKHHVDVAPVAAGKPDSELVLQVRSEPSPLKPRESQTVVGLSIGSGKLSIADGSTVISGPLHAGNLVLSCTALPGDGSPIRTVLWGDALEPEPAQVVAAEPDSARASAAERDPVATAREIVSPIGRLFVGPPVLDALAKPEPPAADEPACKQMPRTKAGGDWNAEICTVEAAPCEASDRGPVGRLLQAANGDKGGAREATVFVVHDDPPGKAAGRLRRVSIDLSLFEACAAVPDVSYSRLTFAQADLRLAFEDGRPLAELTAGEYPATRPSSFVWVGPRDEGARLRAALDLSRARLVCARDYDLMKLGFRFQDLVLAFEPRPAIRPAREDCRVIEREDGLVEDARPVVVVEFDPQHVMEQTILRPQPPPLPDVELEEAITYKGNPVGKQREALIAYLDGLATPEDRRDFRIAVRDAKSGIPSPPNAPTPFASFAQQFEAAAADMRGLPIDQRIYIGPFALDVDAMALARAIQKAKGEAGIRQAIEAMRKRLDQAYDALEKACALRPAREGDASRCGGNLGPEDANAYFRNAQYNESLLEDQDPFYALYRQYWRDTSVEARVGSAGLDKDISKDDPVKAIAYWRTEYFFAKNRPDHLSYETNAEANFDTRFIGFVLGYDQVEDIVGARLSGASRLAFRINCQPVAGLNAEEAGLPKRAPPDSDHPGSGAAAYAPIPFTFEALTDWSRHEPAVTRRARKLFKALPSGLLPPLGNRPAEVDDRAILRFQGIGEGATTASHRMTAIRASLEKAPTELETAIEIPARLILSPAQDAIWRTNRRLPAEVLAPKDPRTIEDAKDPAITLESGRAVAVAGAPQQESRTVLWSARLAIDDVPPSLRVVGSPDLRPMALDFQPAKGLPRLPGHGAPPPGPYAPWFIGPERLDSGLITAEDVNDALPKNDKITGDVCRPQSPEKRFGLIRWLCDRFTKNATPALKDPDFALFRSSLDAYDRHQLVLLSSAYGLPVTGRRQAAGDDVEVAGGLVDDSGQIDPGDAFTLLDARNDQAIYRPIPLAVRELSLTALGGSLLHDTTFKPAAGADDIWGRKIFDGFSVERWQHEIVLGRDRRAEVVYKGYLFPLGHKASLIKITERVFLRTPTQGIKAILRQRRFLNIAQPLKAFPAVGHPHAGRMWCGHTVNLITTTTPDLIDPNMLPAPQRAEFEYPSGLLKIDGPGIGFWPRTDLTPQGYLRFELDIDGAKSSLPMIFLDNLAATHDDVVRRVAEYYNSTAFDVARRMLLFRGQKIRFAPEKKSGDTSYLTQSIVVRAQGREEGSRTTWTGDLTRYHTVGVLEGAEQPPFYPAMARAEIRLEQAERFSGGKPVPVEVQYDGHYVRHGFPEGRPSGAPKLSDADENPAEIFLDLRKVVKLDMGSNGDRSAAVARPNSRIIALGRRNGPMGGDGTVWWQPGPTGEPLKDELGDGDLKKVTDNEADLVSLAAYFNEKAPSRDIRATPATTAAPGAKAPPVSPTGPEPVGDALRQLQILQSYFSGDAKLLGTITLKDLMRLLDLTPDTLPVLKEVVEYGTAAADAANEAAADLATDVKTRILSPLRAVIARLREQWAKLDQQITEGQANLPGGGTADTPVANKPEPLTLASIYPEIETGLKGVETVLDDAIATEDALALASKLAELYESAKRLVRAIEVVAANPVECLQDAVGADVRRRLAVIVDGLGKISIVGVQLRTIVEFARRRDPDEITTWILEHVAPGPAAPPAAGRKDLEDALSDQFSLAIRPVDLFAVASTLLENAADEIGAALKKIASEFAQGSRLSSRKLLEDLIHGAVVEVLSGNADLETVVRASLHTFIVDQRTAVSDAAKKAKDALDQVAKDTKDKAVVAAKAAMRAQIEAFETFIETDLIAQLDKAAATIDPLEVAALVDAANSIVRIFDRVRAVRKAVEEGRVDDILPAAADFAQDVLGVDLTGALADVSAKLGAFGKEVDDRLSRLVAALGLDSLKRDVLVEEVSACALYRKDPANAAGALPVRDKDKHPIGSIDALSVLGAAIDALTEAKANNDEIAEALSRNESKIKTVFGASTYQTFTSFTEGVTTLLAGNGTAAARGLTTDARRLYCNLVDIIVDVRGLRNADSQAGPPSVGPVQASLERWATGARTLRRDVDSASGTLATILRETHAFVERNASGMGAAAGLSAVAAQIGATSGLSDTFSKLATRAEAAERRVAGALGEAVNVAIKLLVEGAGGAAATVETARKAAAEAAAALKSTPVGPSLDKLATALAELGRHVADTGLKEIRPQAVSLSDLRGRKVWRERTVDDLFRGTADPSPFQTWAAQIRDSEASVLSAWRDLRQQVEGVPDYLKGEVEKKILGSGALVELSKVYEAILSTRNDILGRLDPLRVFRKAARRALLVPAGGCAIAEPGKLDPLLKCDGLAVEAEQLGKLKDRNGPLDAGERAQLVGLLQGWRTGKAAPLVVVRQSRDIAVDLLRGNVFAVIDLGAFRDQIEDAVAGLIPTRATLNYDFKSSIGTESGGDAIFQPKLGGEFGLEVRASVDLLARKKAAFRARGYIGAFDIKLIGGLVDALTLQFAGASFVLEDGAKPRFDVSYTNFIIGEDLQFAKQLESYLVPEEGNGVFVQPLTRGAGIEAGYGISLGTLSIGATSFFNVTLNVSAELPFDDKESLFKVSLGRRLAPFTMSVLPFAGSGYFAIYAAADGVRGFEASFEFGGGGALSFGPLSAQARIQVGVFVRVLRVDDANVTTIYGTFFAGGSASIWIFHFATSLSVRLGSSSDGAMYGEATFTFSFSLGLADFDYSVTATKNEPAIGKGASGAGGGLSPANHGSVGAPTRYAALERADRAKGVPPRGSDRSGVPFRPLFDGVYFDNSLLSPIEMP